MFPFVCVCGREEKVTSLKGKTLLNEFSLLREAPKYMEGDIQRQCSHSCKCIHSTYIIYIPCLQYACNKWIILQVTSEMRISCHGNHRRNRKKSHYWTDTFAEKKWYFFTWHCPKSLSGGFRLQAWILGGMPLGSELLDLISLRLGRSPTENQSQNKGKSTYFEKKKKDRVNLT